VLYSEQWAQESQSAGFPYPHVKASQIAFSLPSQSGIVDSLWDLKATEKKEISGIS
jgi:hypothetical protein